MSPYKLTFGFLSVVNCMAIDCFSLLAIGTVVKTFTGHLLVSKVVSAKVASLKPIFILFELVSLTTYLL
ncbi:hypothetical protein D3C80_1693450 [compost metagenome]